MSRLSLTLDEEPQSPDILSDPETVHSPATTTFDESTSTSLAFGESEPMDEEPEWKGISMDEIYRGLGSFGYQQHPPITPSESHVVLFMLPVNDRAPPKAYPGHGVDKWSMGYVRMPHSSHSLYPIELPDGTREFRLRWEVIQEKLLQSFVSSAQFETAILSYNNKYSERWDFRALHHFFEEVVEEDETRYFFSKLLPKIVQLALQLPALVTGAIPLLKQHTNACISLSQLQVAALLANAFLCTFPRRNSSNPQSEYASYPYINFNRLFSSYRADKPNRSNAVMEKLKCLFHYFRRVTSKAPEGTITIQRRYIPKEECPQWEKLDERLPSLHITSKGTIETEGAGLLQVDFANKYVGGGVLNYGCVQEEIRFVICPELMVTMLVSEVLDDTEALIVSGIERYSKYDGYSNNFTWTGDYVDETPRDNSGRRRTSVVAIDALYFRQPSTQFSRENMLRELNKAYVGFSSTEISQENLPAIATGNWGCGAFRGNPKLKVLLQLMAAAVAGRSMVYFTFGDTNLRDSVADMYWHLIQRNFDIAQLFSLLTQYEKASSSMRLDFYLFLYKRSRMKPVSNYFHATPKSPDSRESSSKDEKVSEARKSVKMSNLTAGSVATENEKYEEARIFNMLENTESKDCDKSFDSSRAEMSPEPENHECATWLETSREIVIGDAESMEQKSKTLWDAMRDRESRTISGSRKSGLNLIATTETRHSQKDTTTRNDAELGGDVDSTPKQASPNRTSRSPGAATNQAEKKNNSGGKRCQSKILDFFPRKIS